MIVIRDYAAALFRWSFISRVGSNGLYTQMRATRWQEKINGLCGD
jgi:hypothetical protein